MTKPKIIIVENNKDFRTGLKSLIEIYEFAEVIAETDNVQNLSELLQIYQPEVVLIDINQISEIDIIRLINEQYSDLKIIAISSFSNDDYFYKLIDAGVNGYILKKSDIYDIEKAINCVLNGDNFYSNEIINISKEKIVENNVISTEFELSKNELEILELICGGKNIDEIAIVLNSTSEKIQKSYKNILSYSNCKNTASLVIYALKNKYIQLKI